VLLRGLLSQYAGSPPSGWRFRTDELGKPRVDTAAPAFSLAHTRGLACCAISCGRAVGVDAEALDRSVDAPGIWSRCCSPSEVLDLERLGDSDRQARFLAYWTLKESLSKAVGCGLTRDVTRLSFEIDDEPIRVTVSPPWDAAASWQFGLFQVPGYTVGVSVSAGRLPIHLHEASLERLQ
jgi:4'-phosphopantetheinyl transferase